MKWDLEKLIKEGEIEEKFIKNKYFIISEMDESGMKMKAFLESLGKGVAGFLTKERKEIYSSSKIKPILISDLEKILKDIRIKVLVNGLDFEETTNYLRYKLKLKPLKDFIVFQKFSCPFLSENFGSGFHLRLKKYKKEFEKVIKILADRDSKRKFYELIKFRTNPSLYVCEKQSKNKRLKTKIKDMDPRVCYKNEIYPKKGDFIIEGGGNDGKLTIKLNKLIGRKGMIFVFEPQLDYFNLLVSKSKNIKQIKCFDFALFNKESRIGFDKDAINEKYEPRSIKTVTIDSFVKREKIKKLDFIRLDIEGAEMEALEGAKNTIKKLKPDLSIAVYHKPEHLWKIPLFIKENFPEYKIYFDFVHIFDGNCYATAKKLI